MTEHPLVSVLMAVHNAEATLPAAVESWREQEGTAFELIVVDDGSTDRSGELLREWSESDDRIRVLTQANAGLTRSLVAASATARGKYLARQDADDVSLPGRLAKQVALLDANPEMVLATCWVEDVAFDAEVIAAHRELAHSVALADGGRYALTGVPAHGSVMMRRSAFEAAGGYRSCFYYAQDSDLWLRLAEQGDFGVVPEVLYRRFISTDSISSRFREAQARFCELAEDCFRARRSGQSETPYLEEAEWLAQSCRESRNQPASPRDRATSLRLMAAQVAARDPKVARKLYRMALRLDPTDWRAWKGLAVSWW